MIGGVATAVSSSNAARAQTSAANTANQTQRDFYNQTRADLLPYSQGGQGAYSTLNNLLGVGGNSSTMQSTLEGLPGYQFTRDQGLKSVQNSAAARGLGVSGGALKAAGTYATGLANSTYGNYVNQLQASANLGENAAAQTGTFATQTGQGVASNTIGAGNAQAAAANAQGSSVSNGASSIAQYYTLRDVLGGQNGQDSSAPVAGWYQR